MKKLIKWFKGNQIVYFTLVGVLFYYNGLLLELISFDFAKSDKERSLFRFSYTKKMNLTIHLLFFEFEVFNIYKEQ